MSTEATSLKSYWLALKRHDWYYDFSDDPGVWRAGSAEQARLQGIARESPAHEKLYYSWRDHYNSEPTATGRAVPPPAEPEK